MRIGVAQTRPVRGDIASNIANHKTFVKLAVDYGAHALIFPELSLTGYHPTLAKELAIEPNDHRLEDFQAISKGSGITIGVGAPVKNNSGISISMVLFHPKSGTSIYSKKYLHPDEENFFIPGESSQALPTECRAAIAICYELSVPQHSAEAYKNGAEIYIASVAKSADGVNSSVPRLAAIARHYKMTVLMSNSVGPCEGFESVGKSSIWNSRGLLLRQLEPFIEGLLIVDTTTDEVTEIEWYQPVLE